MGRADMGAVFQRIMSGKRLVASSAALSSAALLSGCFLSPGNFDSALHLQQDGQFTFTYTGEIHFLGLSDLSELNEDGQAASAEFEPWPCYDEFGYDERPCSEDELAEQRETHDLMVSSPNGSLEERQMVQAMLGGIDPDDPEAVEAFASRLQRQAGWRRVDYAGDGLFNIDFAITSRISHDFTFPVIEQIPLSNSFVVMNRREGGRVAIEAPGFSPQDSGNPLLAMMAGMGGQFSGPGTSGGNGPKSPPLRGTFRIVTDGQILTNNTDEGPAASPQGAALQWQISPTTRAAPKALIQIGN